LIKYSGKYSLKERKIKFRKTEFENNLYSKNILEFTGILEV
jgi:hypothetical protein